MPTSIEDLPRWCIIQSDGDRAHLEPLRAWRPVRSRFNIAVWESLPNWRNVLFNVRCVYVAFNE
jgi:hypothetical protein